MGETDVAVSAIPESTKGNVATYSFVNCLRTLAEKDSRRKCIVIIVNSPVIIIENVLFWTAEISLKFTICCHHHIDAGSLYGPRQLN
jgi:hypothetical protein